MKNKKINITILVIFIVIIGVCAYYIATNPVNLGLDLKGGTQVILKPVETGKQEITDESLDKAMLIIMDRIDMLGISEPLVTRDFSNNIVIQLPGVDEPERALEVIGKTAQLEFRVLEGMLMTSTANITRFVELDTETGELVYDPGYDEMLLVSDIYSDMPRIEGKVIIDPESGDTFLVEPGYQDGVEESGDEESPGNELSGNVEDKDASGSPGSENAGSDDISGKALGKFQYNKETGELLFVDAEKGEPLGEILVDSRTGAASLVGPVLLTGDKLAKSAAGYDSNGRIIVTLSFKSEGADIFEDITKNNTGEQLAIVLDEEIKSAPSINQAIPDGEAQIEGIDGLEEAKDISLVLQTGALPVSLVIEESSTIGPTLGRDALNRGLYAGAAGFALILIFMIAYYRGLGLISGITLVVYIIIFWGVIAGIGSALTLPGIAGIILTIGMAVDANVIIFARIREESLKDKSSRIAIGDGFKNGLRTIIDSNVTTLITAAALYRFGTGPIRGFAVTLSLGVVISMLVSLLFMRSILFLAAGLPLTSGKGFLGLQGKKV
ncbi:MAG: protein translocase subunit SecD [Actinobacteria bacterium]|nr:protein translocase subunit SecD [Actinomycetota bacterium]